MAPKQGEDVPMDDAAPAEETAEATASEPRKELEQDAIEDKRPKIGANAAVFHTEDTTINVIQTLRGQMLMSLSEGGFQYLLAGSRASVGLKAGRYLFEVVIIESRDPSDPQQNRTQPPKPKQLVRVGFSTAASSLLLPDSAESVCFDSEGYFLQGKQRQKASQRFGQGQVVAVLLNLESKGENAYTISLFVDGSRVAQPQKLPEAFRGKPLFPAISFRNVALRVNFGPELLRPLPFKCRSIQDAATADCEVRAKVLPKDGKHEVLFPVGVPDEGTFDWLDQFLAKHQDYTELSDRALLDWAAKSGVQRPKGYAQRSCHDKPDMEIGINYLDDLSVTKTLQEVAPAIPRNYIVMEVRGNLIEQERKESVARFPAEHFRRIAKVNVGEPTIEYKTWVQEKMLTDKREKAEVEYRRLKEQAAKRKAALATKKKAEEMRKKKLEAKKAKEAAEKGEADGVEEKKEADPPEPEEAKEMEVEVEPEEEEEKIEEPKAAELTEEELKLSFRKKAVPDLTTKLMNASLAHFTLPAEAEGFDAVEFSWQKDQAKAKAYLNAWVQDRKFTQRVDDLQPSRWFKERSSIFTSKLTAWKKVQQEFQDPARRQRANQQKKKAEEAKRKAIEKAEAEKKEAAEAEAKDEDALEEKNLGEEVTADPEEEAGQTKVEVEINAEELDAFEVEDVADLGNGEPLFSKFEQEDWSLLSLRMELFLLVHAFRHDIDDPERQAFPEMHLQFYYKKYYSKDLPLKSFGLSKVSELIALVDDSVELGSSGVLETCLLEDTPVDNFVRLTEVARRERQQRIDLGDESAALKFVRTTTPAAVGAAAAPSARPGAPAARGGSREAGGKGGPSLRFSQSRAGGGGQKRPSPGASAAGAPPSKRATYGQQRTPPPPAPPYALPPGYGASYGAAMPSPYGSSRCGYGQASPMSYGYAPPYGGPPPPSPSSYGRQPSGYGGAPPVYGSPSTARGGGGAYGGSHASTRGSYGRR